MKFTILTLLILFNCKLSFSQITIERSVIGATGRITNSGSIMVSSNIGEAVTQTFSKVNLVISQGFEQPDTIKSTGINIQGISETKISIYPNPITNQVTLEFVLNTTVEIKIEIFSSVGQQIINPITTTIQNNCKEELDFTQYPIGNYLIIVKSNDGNLYKSFKVQKLN